MKSYRFWMVGFFTVFNGLDSDRFGVFVCWLITKQVPWGMKPSKTKVVSFKVFFVVGSYSWEGFDS